MSPQTSVEYALILNEEEWEQLLSILEQSLIQTHVERRRTEGAAYQEQVKRQERLIRTLTEKVRRLHH